MPPHGLHPNPRERSSPLALQSHRPRPTRLRPRHTYFIHRSTGGDVVSLDRVHRFMCTHDDEKLLRQSRQALSDDLKNGRATFLELEFDGKRKLVGLAFSGFEEPSQLLHISNFVVHHHYRNEGLFKVLCAGAIMGRALDEERFSAICLTTPESNTAYRQAAERLGVAFVQATDVLQNPDIAFPQLSNLLLDRRRLYFAKGWADDPLCGLVTGDIVSKCARLMLHAANPMGLRWTGGSRVRLEGQWGGTDDDGHLVQMRKIACGAMPNFVMLDALPSGGKAPPFELPTEAQRVA